MLHARIVCSPCYPFELSPLNELKRGMLVSQIIVIILYLLAVTLSIISSNIYTRWAVCNCLSFTFRLGRLLLFCRKKHSSLSAQLFPFHWIFHSILFHVFQLLALVATMATRAKSWKKENLNICIRTTGSNFKYFFTNVPHNALHQICKLFP